MDTIFALASARGRAGVAVMRISGPRAHWAVSQLCDLPAPRHAALRVLRRGGEVLDQAVVLTFVKGASFTGEESAELHLHGSVAVIAAVTAALSAMDGLRMAEAGEFTRRAMDNGNLDLTQVEGLADLIDAETESQRKQALRVLSGAIAGKVGPWRADLLRAAALIEATIDFADEDVPIDVTPEVSGLLDRVASGLSREQQASHAAEQIRDGFEVAILGAPNIGKSTLLNALAQREAAITSDIAGTTRDVIEVRMNISGLSVTLLDTAGLRDSDDIVESIGIERAKARAGAADLRIFLLQTNDEQLPIAPREGDIVRRGKGDVAGADMPSVSGKTGAGVDALLADIALRLEGRVASAGVFSRARHRIALTCALEALTTAQAALPRAGVQPELVATEIRVALTALEGILGHIGVEDLLGEIFSSFCIGK
ncbi:MAG: tRNA uridine-5-carboxymethylaminomethyl(34) synthesis GTPase MnmE [Cypionkella sp.]|nr:tRNA uridine-5-carboxymethylaminomethyl(34) synthesis GTPase MnmE [Cypionkella sp.]